MKKPPVQVAPSQSRFALRQKKDTLQLTDLKLDDIKERLPNYLERYYQEKIHKRTSRSLTLHCPFHEDRTPSFVADDKQGTWLFKCFSCGRAGSLIDFHAETAGLNPRSLEAISATAQAVGIQLPDSQPFTKRERLEWLKKQKKGQEEGARRRKESENLATLTTHQRKTLCQKLSPYLSKDWKADLFYGSPIQAETPADAPFVFLSTLFPSEAILWMGEPRDTGSEKHRSHFKCCRDWLSVGKLPSRIAAGHFQADSISRSQVNLGSRPFIVIESDDLIGHKPTTDEERRDNKALSHALAGYCQHELGLHLRAVIDTGNKSLHLWFDRPSEAALDAVRTLAPGLRIDMGLLGSCASAPLRMPGCIHEKTNTPAILYYLNNSPA